MRKSLSFQDGETPLIKATKMRNIDIVELLLDKGAKVSAVDKVSTCNIPKHLNDTPELLIRCSLFAELM